MTQAEHQGLDLPHEGMLMPNRDVASSEDTLSELFAELTDDPNISHMRTLDVVGQDGEYLGSICLVRGPESYNLMNQAVVNMVGGQPALMN
jgi:hypothetical protein